MTRYRLTIEYDGRPFVGWQRQTLGTSVQGSIEAALNRITGENEPVYAAGRTDAGVHARGMVAHVDVARRITPFRLMAGINALLRPAPIAIIGCVEAAPEFHARFDCVSRRYRYVIVNRRAPLTIEHRLAWQVSLPLDAEAMRAAAQSLVGRHDFTTFRSIKCQATSPVRTLDHLSISRDGERIVAEIEARSFLHHQVRSMIGCLKLVGEGSWTIAMLEAALAARDRTELGFNAPPDGLTFVSAAYETSAGFTVR